MHSVTVPDGVGTVIVGAVIAAAGYVGKIVVDVVLDFRKRKRDRRSQLVELRSLLRKAKTSFIIQNQHATRLLNMLRQRDPQLPAEAVATNPTFASKCTSQEQKELHDIIRGITIHALKPTNTEILNCFQRDAYFRGNGGPNDKLVRFRSATWIPDRLEHALVHVDDEQKHGVGF